MGESVSRVSRMTGWLLLVLGTVVLYGYGIIEFARDEHESGLVKVAVATVIVGLLPLTVSVIRRRLADQKSERYGDVHL